MRDENFFSENADENFELINYNNNENEQIEMIN